MFFIRNKDKKIGVLRYVMIVLSLVGALLMVYLTRLHFLLNHSSACDFSERVSCDLVNQSSYSEIFGIPLAALGILFFLSLIFVILYEKKLELPVFSTILTITAFGLAFGLSLSAIEVFMIKSICMVCETSKIVMAAIIGVSAYGAGFTKEKTDSSRILMAVFIGIIFGGLVALGL